MKPIRICIAGATGWAGKAIVAAVSQSTEFTLTGAIARQAAGQDLGFFLPKPRHLGIPIVATLEEALKISADVLVDYTKPDSVKDRVLTCLDRGVRVVVGTSGLDASDYEDIGRKAEARSLGVVAAGNFSITAALAKRFSLLAAQYLPAWEIIDYADATKIDAPSGTTRELAEALAIIKANRVEIPLDKISGLKEARGAWVDGIPIHSIRLPGYVLGFETLFGLPNERLSIHHDAGAGAEPYVAGTLLAVREVMKMTGLIRGLDELMFQKS